MCVNCGDNTCGHCGLPTGDDGLNGYNAFTLTTASFVQPAVSGNVAVTVSITDQFTGRWAQPGQIIFIETGGYYEVVSVNLIGQVITVENLGYTGNAAPAVVIASGVGVSPGGIQGAAGSGTPGANGTSILFSYYPPSGTVTTGTGLVVLQTYSVLAGTLINDGDELYIECEHTFQSPASDSGRLANVQLDGGDITVGYSTFINDNRLFTKITIVRVSATQVRRKFEYESSNSLFQETQHREQFLPAAQTVPDMDTLPMNIDFVGQAVSAPNTVTLTYAKIELKRIV